MFRLTARALAMGAALVIASGCVRATRPDPDKTSQSAKATDAGERFVADGEIPVGPDDAVVGSASALITLVAFFDYESVGEVASWDSLARRTVDEVLRDYRSGVRVVSKHYPMYSHPNARQAAIASQVVLENLGPKWFFSFTKRVIDNEYGSTDDFLQQAATELGIPLKTYREGLRDVRHDRKIDSDIQLAKKIGGDLAPPLFSINGVIANGARPYAWFSGVINQEIGPARALHDSGLTPVQVYERRVAENLANPPKRHHHRHHDHDRPEIRTQLRPNTPLPHALAPNAGNRAAPVALRPVLR